MASMLMGAPFNTHVKYRRCENCIAVNLFTSKTPNLLAVFEKLPCVKVQGLLANEVQWWILACLASADPGEVATK